MPSMQAISIASLICGRAHVQRAPEDEGEAQDVVDLIGKIRPPVAMIASGRHGARGVGQDFGVGLARAKMIGCGAIVCHHLGRQDAGAGQAEEQVGPSMTSASVAGVVPWAIVGLLRRSSAAVRPL